MTEDPDQAGFWMAGWRKMESEADADLAAGRFDRYESDKEFLDALDRQMKSLDADS